jgi:hypothetical protein
LREDKLKLRDRQRQTIGMVYEAIRRINKEIGQLISDQFENVEETQQVAEVITAEVPKPVPAKKDAKKRAPAKKAARRSS